MKKNVQINANNVSVKTNSINDNTKKKKKRNRRKKKQVIVQEEVPSQANIQPAIPNDMPGQTLAVLNPDNYLEQFKNGYTIESPYEGFAFQYLDPNGEHFRTQMYKVPDGAISMSVALQFRFLDTVWPPFTKRDSVDLTGLNYSAVLLQIPTLRTFAIYIVHRHGQEFSNEVMDSFVRAMANLPGSTDPALYFPNWHSTDIIDPDDQEPIIYFCLLSSTNLLNLAPPSELGVSSTISQFRICAQGATIGENSPDLFNQGTCAEGQFNCNISRPVISNDSALPWLYLNGAYVPTEALPVAITSSHPFVIPSMPFSTIPSAVFVSEHNVFSAGGAQILNVDDEWQYVFTSNILQIFNITTGDVFSIATVPPTPTTNVYFTARLYYQWVNGDPVAQDRLDDISLIALPPIPQQAIAQADILAHDDLFSHAGGVYMPLRVWQPVFNMQQAGQYSRVYFANSDTMISDIADFNSGHRERLGNS